jgi:peptidoglycan/xylan/chitin deacetylase (PgdA/CDA1 family)
MTASASPLRSGGPSNIGRSGISGASALTAAVDLNAQVGSACPVLAARGFAPVAIREASAGGEVLGAVAPGSSTEAAVPAAAFRAPRVFRHGSRSAPVVALTFDDGWSDKNAHLILNILLREHVPATFFINSVWLARDPALWRAIATAGFVVGNHTYRHQDATTMTTDALVRDLERNARIWLAVTGHPMAPLFRPPYGARNAATDQAAAMAGFPDVITWDALAEDTYRHTDAQMIRLATAGRAGSIVLMHVGPDATPRILERVIASYRARGFRFVTVPELLPPFRPAPPPVPVSAGPATAREPEIFLRGIS